jgi:hypothetical protein
MAPTILRTRLTATFIAAAMLAFCGAAPAVAGQADEELNRPINPPCVEHTLDVNVPEDTNNPWPQFCQDGEDAPKPCGDWMPTAPCRPAIAAPLPPAVLTGGMLLAGNWVVSIFRKRRRI